MAIWQFYLGVFPKQALLKKHGEIPTHLQVGTEDLYFETNIEEYWALAKSSPNELVNHIDSLLNRADWGNTEISHNWKTQTDEVDNDAHLHIDEETGFISELTFRADLRESDLAFLKSMIDLGNKYDWMFMDIKGKLTDPNFKDILVLIRESRGYRFLQDPKKFSDDFEQGELDGL